MNKRVYTIIVTFNAAPWIEKCLTALLRSDLHPEVIVVDNASQDNTKRILENYQDRIHLIQNESNLKFGRANNQGIQYALDQGAKYLFLLNQDAYVFENTIGLLKEALDNFPDYGIISALQLQSNEINIDNQMWDYIKRSYPNTSVEEVISAHTYTPLPLRFVNAASWLLSRKCVMTTGLFHPVFSHYGEDNHYCSRAQYHKFKTGFLPAARVIHDRNEKVFVSPEHLIRGLKTTPLYTALDLRKKWPLAWLLSRLKIKSAYRKLLKANVPHTKQLYDQNKKWFLEHKKEILRIRKETMKPWKENQNDGKF